MIKIVETTPGRRAPVVICDVCGKQIENHADCNVVWKYDEPEMRTVHQGACDRTLQSQSFEWKCAPWWHMQDFLVMLLNNVGLTREAMAKYEQEAVALGQA